MSLSKKVVLTVSGYKISLSDSLQFYQNDQLKLIFEINKYGIDVASSFTHKTLMPLQPLTATLFIETPLGVDSIESANIEDNAVTFYLTSNQTQHIGTSSMQIKLTDDDGCQITLPSFTFEVQENIYDNAVHVSGILLADENGNVLSDENGNTVNATATTETSKQIKDFTLKTGVSGQEDILVQDNGVTKRIKSSELIDTVDLSGYATKTDLNDKANVSQEKIREIESELNQTNAQLSKILSGDLSLTIEENENVISISNYSSMKEAISYAKANNKIIDLKGKTIVYNMSENLLVDSVEIRNGVIEITSDNRIVMTGDNPTLRNIKIKMYNDAVGGLNNGVIELHNSTGATLENVYADISIKWSFLFCKTRATNTFIKNLTLTGDLRYGILFNDACSEQGSSFRIVDNVDYADAPIGKGLYIEHYKYINTASDTNTTHDGDAIEINCPDYGFEDIIINNANVDRARHIGGASGMGLGFSNCKNIIINTAKIYNCGFDGIHFENKCENVYVTDFQTDECVRGISVGSCKNVSLTNGTVNNCTVWLAMTNLQANNEEVKFYNVVFNSNKILNESFYPKVQGFEASALKKCVFRDVKCINNGSTGYGFLNLGLSQYLGENTINTNNLIDLQGCVFDNFIIEAENHTITSPRKIIELGKNSKGNIFRCVKLYGYGKSDLVDFNTLDSSKNILERYSVNEEFFEIGDIILINLLNLDDCINYNIGADGAVNANSDSYAYKIEIEYGKRYGLYRANSNGDIIAWQPRIAITDKDDVTLNSYIATSNDITIANLEAKYMYVWNPGWGSDDYRTYKAMILKNFEGSQPSQYINY